ncbi:MAG TPA: hypothetical protein VGN16_08950 [Acidobacteriaceae bacterium]|jgi:hypothetical protein
MISASWIVANTRRVCAGGAAAVAISFFVIHQYYLLTCPRTPFAPSGQIYPLDVHGWIVYLTRAQDVVTYVPLGIAVYTAIVLLAARAAVNVNIARRKRRGFYYGDDSGGRGGTILDAAVSYANEMDEPSSQL